MENLLKKQEYWKMKILPKGETKNVKNRRT